MENASLHLAGVDGHRRDLHRPPAPRLPRRQGLRRHRRRRHREGHAAGQAGRHGRLLGLAYGPDRPAARARRQSGRSSRPPPRRGRSTSASTARSCRWSTTTPQIVAALKADHEATLAYVRRPVGETAAPLYSYFALVADDPSVQIVNQAQTWYIEPDDEGHRVGGPADPLGGGPVQGRRPRRPGLLHRRAGRPRRDQERRRPLPLSQHHPGGRDHRRRRCKEWLETLGRHLQPDRSRARPTSR